MEGGTNPLTEPSI